MTFEFDCCVLRAPLFPFKACTMVSFLQVFRRKLLTMNNVRCLQLSLVHQQPVVWLVDTGRTAFSFIHLLCPLTSFTVYVCDGCRWNVPLVMRLGLHL